MEDWSDILTPLQWSKAVKLPVIVYNNDKPKIHPIADVIPLKVSVAETARKSPSPVSPRGTLITEKVYLKRHHSEPVKKLIPKDSFRSTLSRGIPVKPLVRFRRAVKTVQVLLKAIGGARKGQNHKQQKQRQGQNQLSWSQFYDEHSTARRTYDLFGISFDPTVFKAKREKNLSSEAKVILSLDPSERVEDQLRITLLALNQAVDSFGEFPIKLQRSLASVGWYEQELGRIVR